MAPETSKRKKNDHLPVKAEVERQALEDFLADQPRQVASQVEDLSPADGADVIQNLPSEEAADVAEYLDPNTAANILARMEPESAASVVSDMEEPEAAVMLDAMNPDDRVDILAHVEKGKRDALMLEMSAEDAAEVRQLEKYPPESAGGIMTTQVTALYEYITVENAIGLLRRLNEELEQMFYVYVIDRRQHLVGVLSMRDLILAKPEKPLREIMIQSVRSVPATMPQEEVAKFMRKYGYLAVPVVDEQGKLIGLITLDDVIDVIEQETTGDVQRMFGAGAEERLSSPWHFSFKKRVWWLQVNLATAFMAAAIVSLFTDTIAAVPVLAAYQTIVSGMGGNAGAQAMAVSIRGIAVGESARVSIMKVLKREFMVGLMSGIVIGLTTGLIATIFNYSHHGVLLGLIIFTALLVNHVNACVTGVCVPFVMKRLGFDPAQSATIFATTFTDCGGFFVCLGLAKVCMPWLIG
jgi:magnesium transporter